MKKLMSATLCATLALFSVSALADTQKAANRMEIIEQPYGKYVRAGDGSTTSALDMVLLPDENALAVNIMPDTKLKMEYYISLYDQEEGYYITKNSLPGAAENMIGPISEGTFTFTGLRPGGHYAIRISSAINTFLSTVVVTGTNRPTTEGVTYDVSNYSASLPRSLPTGFSLDAELGLSDTDIVTRGQMATLIRNLLPEPTERVMRYRAGDPPFTDVEFDSMWQTDIEALYGLKIVSGMGDGLFVPDGSVTIAQAIKMTVASLGYGSYAESLGGWPEGYIECGRQLGIMSERAPDDTALWSDVSIMLRTALTVPHMHISEYAPNGSMKMRQNPNITYEKMLQ